MKLNRLKFGGMICVLFCSLFFISCNNKEKPTEVVEGVKVNKGSIIEIVQGDYYNYNLIDGSYKTIQGDERIGLYDYLSGNYIFQEEGKYIAFYNGKKVVLENVSFSDSSLNISPGGEYLSFFRRDDDGIYNPVIITLKDGKEQKFDTQVGFSWRDMDWLDDENLVYYGVSEDKINGIFTYNIKTSKEELLFELEGVVQFIKSVDSGVIILQDTIDSERILKEIGKENGKETIITDEFIEVDDIIKEGNSYYVLGRKVDSNKSLFKIESGNLTRMVFDFPEAINGSKGLSVDEKGNILFAGIEDSNGVLRVYKCSSDGTISKVSEKVKDFIFLGRHVR